MGVGAFAGLFAGMFGAFASFLATWVTKKTAFGLAAVAVFGVLTAGLMAVIATSISAALSMGNLPSSVAFGFWYFMPSNLPACVSAIIAADVATALYRWNVENLRIVSYVT